MSPPKLFSRAEVIGLTFLALAAFAIGLGGIYHLGYIGQDYTPHRETILGYPDSFSYHLTDPPGYYWMGSLIYHHLSATYYLELTALVFLIFNTLALAIIYRLVWQCISNQALRWAAVALITFLPVRLIHGIVIAADATTLPIFALVALFTLQIRENPRRWSAWLLLAVTCSLGLRSKYVFSGVLAPLALILGSTVIQRMPAGQRLRGFALLIATLAVPVGILVYSVRQSAREQGAMTDVQWLPPNAPSVMRWQDILTPQASDVKLLSAPAYFRDSLYSFRIYSYPGLVFISTYTDVFNLFQPPPQEASMKWDRRMKDSFFRERSDFSQRLQAAAVCLSFPFYLLAIVGTLVCGALGLQALLTRHSHLTDAAVVVTALAAGIYSPVFFGLHRIANPYGEGFWTARLILPTVVIFQALGFVLLDLALKHWVEASRVRQVFLGCLLGWTAVTCALYIGFLV